MSENHLLQSADVKFLDGSDCWNRIRPSFRFSAHPNRNTVYTDVWHCCVVRVFLVRGWWVWTTSSDHLEGSAVWHSHIPG